MKRTLPRLPANKRRELLLVIDIIRKKFKAVQMIILFGSYAKGKAVEHIRTEGHTIFEYRSDFDILIVTETQAQAESQSVHDKIEDTIFANKKYIDTDVNIIYHDIEDINRRLKEGQYFFSDIKREGRILYDTGQHKLARKQKMDMQQRKKLAQEDFKFWFHNAEVFYFHYENALKINEYRSAAFMLHQATEAYYAAVQLVFTGYKRPIHNVEKLGRLVAKFDPRLFSVFTRSTKAEKESFKLLKQAYVGARYKKKYKINAAQTKHLGSCVKNLHPLTKTICKEKMESFV